MMPFTPQIQQSHRDLLDRTLNNAMSGTTIHDNGPSPYQNRSLQYTAPRLLPPTVLDDASSQGSARTMTKDEYKQELRKMGASLDALKVRHRSIEDEKFRWLQGHRQEYERGVALDAELARLRKEMDAVKQRSKEYEQELKELKAALKRAHTTIHVQSQTIQGRTIVNATPYQRQEPAAPYHQQEPAAEPAARKPVYVQNYGFGQ
ncbi:MAG: hypothetical protein Q9218_008027, partial [Villophora microphyllina]